MLTYESMYIHFRPTVISGHTRFITGHRRHISGLKTECPIRQYLHLFRCARPFSQPLSILISMRDIEASLLRNMECWSFLYSLDPPDVRGVDFRDQLAYESGYQKLQQLSRSTRRDYWMLWITEITHCRPNPVRIQFLQDNWAQSSAQHAAPEWSYLWIHNTGNQSRSRSAIYESALVHLLPSSLRDAHSLQLACATTTQAA